MLLAVIAAVSTMLPMLTLAGLTLAVLLGLVVVGARRRA